MMFLLLHILFLISSFVIFVIILHLEFFCSISPQICHPFVLIFFSSTSVVQLSNADNTTLITRAHSFPRQNLTNSAANLVNSAVHRGKADEIPRLTAATQLNSRGLIKS